YTLVDGQGNFGSIDGDNPAAMRYCITGDSLLPTKNGLFPISTLSKEKEAKINEHILSFDGKENKASKFFNSGLHRIIKIQTEQGYSIRGSYNHPLLCWAPQASGKPRLVWKTLEKICKGDIVVLHRGRSIFAKKAFPLVRFCPKNKNYQNICTPKKMNSELAFLLGALVSEGSFHQGKILFINSDAAYYNKVKSAILSQFRGVPLYERAVKGGCMELDLYYQKAVRFLVNIGLSESKADGKQIPFSVLNSKQEHISSFLQGLFEGDGTVRHKVDKRHQGESFELAYHSKSMCLINQLKFVLLNFGIATTAPYADKRNGCYKLQITGVASIKLFNEKIGFFSKRKASALSRIRHMNENRMSKTDFVPFISIYLRKKYGGSFLEKNNVDRYPLIKKNYSKLSAILDADDLELVDVLLKQRYFFNPVDAVHKLRKKEAVYSIRVDSKCHSFVANGFINHNTEVRMHKMAGEMLADIEKETVDFAPNFDGTLQEPKVLPSKLPNLLINGSSGIAVGMATNMPPHNLGEVCEAITTLIDKPEIEDLHLAEIVKGPDFPTGGLILGRSGILQAYLKGRGSIRMRGVAEIVQSKKDKNRQIIKITEIPYQVNKASLVKLIAELVRDKKIEGISDVADYSDKKGIEVSVELKKGANADVVLNQLYSKTPLQSSFGIINLALVGTQPKVLTLREILAEFILHRREVIRRRCTFDLGVAKSRKHILEGLAIALSDIDKIVATIKAASDVNSAREKLIAGWRLSEKQANAILEMRLSKLTSLERTKLEEENIGLAKLIEELLQILADPKKIDSIIKKETTDIKDNYADERRTKIIEWDGAEIEDLDLIPDEPAAIIVTENDYIKRISLDEYRSQKRGGKGVIGTETKEEDRIRDILVANTHDTMLFFTNEGMIHWLPAYKIPEGSRYSKGKAIVNLLELKEGKISSCMAVREFKESESLVMATRNGVVKRTTLDAYSRPRRGGIRAITLREGDELISVRKTDGNTDILLATIKGQAIRFPEDEVREIGRSGQGVKGISLREGDKVVDMALCISPTFLTVCENGYGKRTEVDDYRRQGRAGSGIINIKTSERNGDVVGVRSVCDEDEIILLSSSNKAIRMPAREISVLGRNTQGVRLMRLEEGEKIVAMEHIRVEDMNGNAPSLEGSNGDSKPPGPGEGPVQGQEEAKPQPPPKISEDESGDIIIDESEPKPVTEEIEDEEDKKALAAFFSKGGAKKN
ncbi:MAG: DNA gyrase subunit A, partial [Candidatus Micrarchaeota archaeon]